MAKSKSKSRKIIFFSILLLLIAGLATVAILKKKDVSVSVQVDKAKLRSLTELVVANGKIQPVTEVKISPEVSGEILELPHKEGQTVKKGELLVSIRPDNYVATRDSSLANYKYSLANSNNAAANLEKANLEYQRNQNLFNSKLISDSDYLTAKTAYDVAKATLDGASEQVGMALASLQSSESDLSKTKIYSPLSGRVTKLNSQVGERVVGTAMMAGTEIMTISDLTEMEARVDIGEVDVNLIAVGQKVRLEVDAFKDQKFEGIVTDIANSAINNDANSTTTSTDATKFQVKIRIKEKELFLPGMSVTAEIETRSRTNVVTIPIQCVTTRLPKDGNGKTISTNSVTKSDDASNNRKKPDDVVKSIEVVFVVTGDTVKMTSVKRGISDDNYVEIVSGVKEGDRVVTGNYKAINRELEDGTAITIEPAKSDVPAKAVTQ